MKLARNARRTSSTRRMTLPEGRVGYGRVVEIIQSELRSSRYHLRYFRILISHRHNLMKTSWRVSICVCVFTFLYMLNRCYKALENCIKIGTTQHRSSYPSASTSCYVKDPSKITKIDLRFHSPSRAWLRRILNETLSTTVVYIPRKIEIQINNGAKETWTN